MLELLFAFLIGVLLGVLAGILPGLHPNTLIPVLLGVSFLFSPLAAAVILVTAGVVNVFVNFIPSMLLGAPEESTALSVLPGHRLLLEGRGYEAVKLAVTGGLSATLLSVLMFPLFAAAVPVLYSSSRACIPWLLGLVMLCLVIGERGKLLFALAVLVLSGALGVLVLDDFGNGMLFPLLSGLFGLPMLLLSARSRVQPTGNVTFEERPLPRLSVLYGVLSGLAAGVLVGLLPGVGGSQATVLTQMASSRSGDSDRTFLISLGGVNAADVMFSIFALWLIGNPRSGIAVAAGQLIDLNARTLLLLTAVIVASAGIGSYLALKLSRRFVFALRRVDYPRLCLLTALFVVFLVALFTGPYGLLVLFASLSIGLVANLSGVRRSLMMACLMVPTVLYFISP